MKLSADTRVLLALLDAESRLAEISERAEVTEDRARRVLDRLVTSGVVSRVFLPGLGVRWFVKEDS